MPTKSNAKNDGRRFEDLFARVADQYHFRKLMRLEKVGPPVRFAGPGRIIFLENPFPDWTGTWTERGGRTVMLETKSTADDKLPISDSKLTDTQISWLEKWHYAGAVTGVIWESNFRVGFLPIGRIIQVWQSGRRHFKFEEADPVPQGNGFVLFDFIENIRRWYPA